MNKENVWQKLIIEIQNLIFPTSCLGCDKEGEWLCKKCMNKIPHYKKGICPWCEMPSGKTELCPECKKSSHLDSIFIITDYQNILLQKLLHNIKYNFAWSIADSFKPLINRYFNQPYLKSKLINNDSFQLIIPIPLHKKRLQERGFNQSELLAKIIALHFNAKLLTTALIRKSNTKPQMTLNRKGRQANIQGAFECSDSKLIKSKKILVVDDVLTTGATIKEAALTLKRAGCYSVSGLVLAKEGLISQQKNGRVN